MEKKKMNEKINEKIIWMNLFYKSIITESRLRKKWFNYSIYVDINLWFIMIVHYIYNNSIAN